MTRIVRRTSRRLQAVGLIPVVALSSYIVVGSQSVSATPTSDSHTEASAQEAQHTRPARSLLLVLRWEPFWKHPSGLVTTVTPTPAPEVTEAPALVEPATPAVPAPHPRATSTVPAAPAPAPAPAVPAKPVTTAGRPGASSTGVPAGTTLTPSAGLQITTANQVIDGADITGQVTIEAPGVVIKNSRIHGDDVYGILVRSGSVTITDTEIFGFENGIAGDSWTALRVNVHSVYGDGMKFGDDVTLQDSWIHDVTPSADAHADGGQMQSGVRNLVIKHNVIDMSSASSANSALFIAPDLGPSTSGPVTIDGNWLDGGNFTLYCVDGNNGQYFVKNISITNNKFGRGAAYGPSRINVPVSQSGNVWADTGAPLGL
ncbi:MAG: hypothetical protein ACOH17_08795 [Cellulomonas sp.]